MANWSKSRLPTSSLPSLKRRLAKRRNPSPRRPRRYVLFVGRSFCVFAHCSLSCVDWLRAIVCLLSHWLCFVTTTGSSEKGPGQEKGSSEKDGDQKEKGSRQTLKEPHQKEGPGQEKAGYQGQKGSSQEEEGHQKEGLNSMVCASLGYLCLVLPPFNRILSNPPNHSKYRYTHGRRLFLS